jgi:hypothetical protein
MKVCLALILDYLAYLKWYRKMIGGTWYYNRYHAGGMESAIWIWERKPARPGLSPFYYTCWKVIYSEPGKL